MSAVPASNRRHMRFITTQDSLIEIGSLDRKSHEFQSLQIGFPINESFGGCCFALRSDHKLEVGDVVWVRLEKEVCLEAEIKWVKKLDVDIHKIGIQYID